MIKRKIFVFAAMLIAAAGMFFYARKSRLHAEQKKDERPNILFILTDDQRWDTLGVYGNKDIKTPNMDKLAKEGARFDAAYIASPLCCPSRSVFLTGKYPHQTGVLTNERDIAKIQEDWVTVAKALNNAGYVTGLIGKAHIDGKPLAWGFKDVPVYLPGGASWHQNPILVVNGQETEMKNGVVKINEDGEEEIHPLPQVEKDEDGKSKDKKHKKKNSKKNRKGIVVQGLITEIFADAAVKFLERHKNDRFFLWFASTAPHLPYYRDPTFPYDKNKLTPPPGYPNKTLSASDDWAGYYSTISHLDFHIGRILQKLHDLGLDKNTIIIFTSDNGFMMGSHGLEGKQVWYEESVRMPWLVRWTGKIKAGSVMKTPVDSADFFPTVLDIAGAPMPDNGKGYEGISFLPALGIKKNPQAKLREVAYSEVRQKSMLGGRHWQMAKKENIKYVWFDDGTEILYDMKKDPHEFKNVAGDKSYTKNLNDMRALHKKWLEDTPELADKIKSAQK